MAQFKKVNDTSIRVLETLKILSQGSVSINEIISYFEKKDSLNRIYTSEVILKYINTLKVFGLRIVKEKDKYVLLNSICQFNFSEADLKSLLLLEKFASDFPGETTKSQILEFLQELERRFDDKSRIIANSLNKKIIGKLNFCWDKYLEQIKLYEKYCAESHRLKIIYNEYAKYEKSVIVEPVDIKYIENSVYFCVYNSTSAQIQNINFDSILKVEQFPSKSNPRNTYASVTFVLKDRLAKSYNLHEGEKVVNIYDDGSIVVMNQKEDRKLLLKRLMRYGENCEVIAPHVFRTEMAHLIQSTLANYMN